MLNKAASNAFQSFSDSIRSKAHLFYITPDRTDTVSYTDAEEETATIQPPLWITDSHIHLESSPKTQQKPTRPTIFLSNHENMAPALDVKIPSAFLDEASEHSSSGSDSTVKREVVPRTRRPVTSRVPSDAYEADVEMSSDSSSDTPAMGSRYKWNQARAIRDNRYQAIQGMGSVGTCSDVNSDSDLELVRLPARSPSLTTMAAEQIKRRFDDLAKEDLPLTQYDPERDFNAARLPVFNSERHLHKEDGIDQAIGVNGIQPEHMRETMTPAGNTPEPTDDDRIHRPDRIISVSQLLYELDGGGPYDARDDNLDAYDW